MKKAFIFLSSMALCLVFLNTAEGHAIWIESNTKATRNKPHQVKIFYGEYPEGAPDSTKKWFSDLKDLDVWVISPSNNKIKLSLADAATHMVSSFLPAEDGTYCILTSHTTKELGGTTRYEFSSIVAVSAGNATAVTAIPGKMLAIIIKPGLYKRNQVIELQVMKGDAAWAEKEVVIMSPHGWIRTAKTNGKGHLSFVPEIKGSYVIEASDYKAEEGAWNQKKYTHTWNGSTTHIIVR